MSKKNVTNVVFSGGFHNVNPITLRVGYPEENINLALGCGELVELLTVHQVKRLEKHFCGISGCKCGSWTTAKVTI